MAPTRNVNLRFEPSTPVVFIHDAPPCSTAYIIDVPQIPSPNPGQTTIAGEQEERPTHIRLKTLKKEAKLKVETPPPSYDECVEKGIIVD